MQFEKRIRTSVPTSDHVCLIHHLNNFVRAFTRRQQPIDHMCPTCLSVFNSENDQSNHTSNCTSPSTIIYPKPGTHKNFSKKHALYPMSFCCFLDLESLNKQTEIHEDESILAKQ